VFSDCFLVLPLSACLVTLYVSLPSSHIGLNEQTHPRTGWFDKQDPPGVLRGRYGPLWLHCSLCWRHTQDEAQWWACPGPAACGPEELTAILNSPWEASVMDSLGLHTLALCIKASWTLFLSLFFTQCHTVTLSHTFFSIFFTQASFFPLLSSWSECGKSSFCCKARHCHGKQLLTCLCFSLTLYFAFCSFCHSYSPYWRKIENRVSWSGQRSDRGVLVRDWEHVKVIRGSNVIFIYGALFRERQQNMFILSCLKLKRWLFVILWFF